MSKLKQMAAFLDVPFDRLGQPLPPLPTLLEKANAIGDQCCEYLYVITAWQRERGR